MTATTGTVTANGIDFHFLEMGTGPLALCLHGFPDSAHGWKHQLPALAEAGYRAVAPFMRGYAPTSVAADGCYQTGALAADANALHEALGADGSAVLIGHDWGAMATYPAVNSAPERWAAMVAAAVPHPAALAGMVMDYAQLKRSFYMFLFQLPLAEMVVSMNDLAFIDGLWADWSPGFDGAESLAAVKDALRAPENLSAAIGYYRATWSGTGTRPEYDQIQGAGAAPVTIPALYLHGRDDGCVGVDYAERGSGFLTHERSRTHIVEGAGHFLQIERPDEFNRLVVEFLTGS